MEYLKGFLPLGGVAVIAVVASMWGHFKLAFSKIRSFVIISSEVNGPAAFKVRRHLQSKVRRLHGGDRYYSSFNQYVHPLARTTTVAYESVKGPSLVWAGKVPMFISSADKDGRFNGDVVKLTYLRGTVDIDAFLAECLQGSQESRTGFCIRRMHGSLGPTAVVQPSSQGIRGNRAFDYMDDSEKAVMYQDGRLVQWSWEDLTNSGGEDPLSTLVLSDTLRSYVTEFDRWLHSERWFRSKNIPWRRGWNIYGGPGGGKSSFVKVLAQRGNIPLFQFDISTMSNNDLVENWAEAMAQAPCIILIEDIDNVFDGRVNVNAESVPGSVTFDCLLNVISGVAQCDGVFLAITTNNISKVDPALGREENGKSTRPGRIDRVIEIPAMDETQRRKLAERILSDCPEEIDAAVAATEGYMAIQVIEHCTQIALPKFWQGA